MHAVEGTRPVSVESQWIPSSGGVGRPLTNTPGCFSPEAKSVSQSVSHYHTPSRELMDHTHSTVLLFRVRWLSLQRCIFLFYSLVFRQGPHLRMMFIVMFFLPFAFHLCFLSLILMRTDLVVEPSTQRRSHNRFCDGTVNQTADLNASCRGVEHRICPRAAVWRRIRAVSVMGDKKVNANSH